MNLYLNIPYTICVTYAEFRIAGGRIARMSILSPLDQLDSSLLSPRVPESLNIITRGAPGGLSRYCKMAAWKRCKVGVWERLGKSSSRIT